MARQCFAQTPSAYGFPLLIKGLLESGVTRAPEQEIVSSDSTRLTYQEFAERVGRLASGLAFDSRLFSEHDGNLQSPPFLACILTAVGALIFCLGMQHLTLIIYYYSNNYYRDPSSVPFIGVIAQIPIVGLICQLFLYALYNIGGSYAYLKVHEGDPGPSGPMLGAYTFGVGVLEEATKFLLALALMKNREALFKKGSDLRPLAIALVTAGLGFGIGEAVWYFYTTPAYPGMVAWTYVRAIPLPLVHASWVLFNGMICRFFCFYPFKSFSNWVPFPFIVLPGAMVHGYYDTICLYTGPEFNIFTFTQWTILVVSIAALFLVLFFIKVEDRAAAHIAKAPTFGPDKPEARTWPVPQQRHTIPRPSPDTTAQQRRKLGSGGEPKPPRPKFPRYWLWIVLVVLAGWVLWYVPTGLRQRTPTPTNSPTTASTPIPIPTTSHSNATSYLPQIQIIRVDHGQVVDAPQNVFGDKGVLFTLDFKDVGDVHLRSTSSVELYLYYAKPGDEISSRLQARRVGSKPVAQFEKDKTYRVEVYVELTDLPSMLALHPGDLLEYEILFSEQVEFVGGSNTGILLGVPEGWGGW